MPNRHDHELVGAVAGAVYALARAHNQQPEDALVECFGGALGGVGAARLPDILEPAVTPRHHGVAHALLPVGAGARALTRLLDDLQERLRAEARRQAALHLAAATPLEGLRRAVLEFLCRLGAGALVGVLAGYCSHVALDAAFNRASIPLLGA